MAELQNRLENNPFQLRHCPRQGQVLSRLSFSVAGRPSDLLPSPMMVSITPLHISRGPAPLDPL